jgi:hypothetical protein
MAGIDLSLLFKLRLIVARFGEMDCAKWWNTQGILGRYGTMALSRGFPRTHRFAQAKVAFAVAAQRCREVYPHPNAYTLWDLPPDIEDTFNEKWHGWIGKAEAWEPVFQSLEDISGAELLDLLQAMALATPEHIEKISGLKGSAEGHSVQIAEGGTINDDLLVMLAAAFCKGEAGKPIIPYISTGTANNQ